MGKTIHARVRRGGTFVYRIWHTVVDSYVTPELNYTEVWRYLRADCIDAALRSFNIEVDERLSRARVRGSSGYREHEPLDAPWNQPSEEWGADNPIAEPLEDPEDLSEDHLFLFAERGSHCIGDAVSIYGRIEEAFAEEAARQFVAWADLSAIGEVWRYGEKIVERDHSSGDTVVRYAGMVTRLLPDEGVKR